MEPKYHPTVYIKKRKESDKDLIKNIVENKEGIVCTKPMSKHQIGSPFFQVDSRENSEGSKRTKAKTFNNTSDRSNDGSSVKDKEECIKSEKLNSDAISLAFFE